MDLDNIIKRSWTLARSYRSLWGLGIIASLAGGNFSSSSNIYEFGQKQTSTSIILITAVLLVILITLIYIGYSAKAGLILSVNDIESGDKAPGFKKSFHKGRRFAWRLFGLNLLVGLIILGILAGLSVPVILSLLISQSLGSIILAIILGTLALIVFVVFVIYYKIILQIAERAATIKSYPILEALHFGRRVFRAERNNIIVVWLISVALGFAYSFVILLGLLAVGAALFGIGYLIFLGFQNLGALIYGIPVGLALLVALFIVGGFFSAFISSYWTLVYRALETKS